MKNLVFLFATLFVLGFSVNAQEEQDPNAPVMDFQFETYDFGEIQEGDPAQVDFEFTNNGGEKLVISNVKASCGCTTPFWSQEPVMPGENGKITAKYNTHGRIGNFNKAITITSNANPSVKRVFIKGKVVKEPTNDGIPKRSHSIVNDLSAQ